MNDEQFSERYAPAELIIAKFNELKDSALGKYFFLYFLHLMGYLTYKEENGESFFTDAQNTFIVPFPVIDSEAKYKELERVHRNLEKFFEFLKKQGPPAESYSLNLLENI